MSGFTTIAELDLEPDLDETRRGTYESIDDTTHTLIGRENRIAIARGAVHPVRSDELGPDRVAHDVAIMMVVHAHPECRFTWSRLIVDLAPTPEAVIEDMVPCEVEETAVEIETNLGAGLSFSTNIIPAKIELKPELSRKQTVYFPTVTSSGTGFRKAYWDFQAVGDSYLHTNRELRLLISAPAGSPITATFTARAHLAIRGLKNYLPVRGRNRQVDATVRLTGTA